ncbi:hypothetical protein D9758_011340 [Tetrapyrgos nigripes]|uniref:Enoyl reductase (ER) domain-containing protein n=1 Tax=Tetrapyrgos nigripes TaxID=182062 RepID=A0A8H5G860_9AGAR|nr:hypothetical protein D9758_011340 [Tetrapyrgos nigripes]
MAPVRNAKLLFKEVPKGYPEPGKTTVYDTSDTIDLDTVALNGSILIKVLYLSADPYMRGKMRDPNTKSYSPPFTLGAPIDGFGIGKVVRSEKEGLKEGDIVSYHAMQWVEYMIPEDTSYIEKLDPLPGLSLSTYIGAIGMPGKTAYMAWKEYAKAKKGETAFVSTAAGAVGAIVVQLAKLDGMKVIASVGSDEKVQFAKEIGADVVFNYKTTDTEEVLAKEGPIDVYWDNVGGSTLDAALGNSAVLARFIECGMISGYNSGGQPVSMKNLMKIVSNQIDMHGFIVSRLFSKYNKEFNEVIPKLIKEGKIKHNEDLTKGLEFGGEALLDVQVGNNTGKKVVVVAEN